MTRAIPYVSEKKRKEEEKSTSVSDIFLFKMRSILKEKWFYGFLSGEESIRLLQGQPTGTYLVRFSRSRPGSFALSFVWVRKPAKRIHSTRKETREKETKSVKGGNVERY
jgi:hypothetical protein